MGWSAGSKLKAQVDSIDLGNVALESWVTGIYAPLITPTFTNTVTVNTGTLATPVFSLLNATQYLAADGNSEKLTSFIFRNTGGTTGFASAAWRIQRTVDATDMGFL